MNIIKPSLVATYKDIFDNSTKESIDELLSILGRDDVISFCSLIIMNFHSPNYDKWEYELVNNLLLNLKVKQNINLISKFNKLLDENNLHPWVFHIISALRLINIALKNLKNVTVGKDQKADIVILKVFLILNEEIIEPTNRLIDQSNILTYKEKYLRAMIPGYMLNSEFIILKDAIIQSIKFRMFIEYLTKHDKYNVLVDEYFNKYRVSNWEEYLKYIFILYTEYHKTNNEYSSAQISYKLSYNGCNHELKAFVNNLIINENIEELKTSITTEIQDNYVLRKYPFYLSEDKFLIILNINFLSDHIFQTIYFDLRELISERFGNKLAEDFKSIYSYEFSQKVLFEKTINHCFCDKRYFKKFSLDKDKKSECSDAYIRRNKKIFLIEFKDYLLSRDLKFSLNYEFIYDFIVDRFVEKKGIVQLLKIIDNIDNGGFEFDPLKEMDYFKEDRLVIQPIIVVSDMALITDGINYLINELFKKKLEEEKFKNKINDIVLIHIDLFLRYQDELHSNKININSIISEYNGFIKRIRSEAPLDGKVNPNEFITFDSFFLSKIKNKKINFPNAFEEISNLITDL